jgi:endonuclease YncB( thermonuclease family)
MTIAFCACSPVWAAAEQLTIRAQAVRVWSGDTIIAAGKRYRIAGVRAPQSQSKGCFYERIQAQKARSGLRQLLSRGKITITPTGETDATGVALARVAVNGADIGKRLINLRLALPPTRFKTGNPWCEWFLSQ